MCGWGGDGGMGGWGIATYITKDCFFNVKVHFYQLLRKMIQIEKQAKDGNSFHKEPANFS